MRCGIWDREPTPTSSAIEFIVDRVKRRRKEFQRPYRLAEWTSERYRLSDKHGRLQGTAQGVGDRRPEHQVELGRRLAGRARRHLARRAGPAALEDLLDPRPAGRAEPQVVLPAAAAGKPGGKPLAATQDEKEMEVDRRKEAQKACQRLIVPRQPKEDADVFLRRLDAHRNAPEQLFAPQMPGEEPMQACKRLIAGKKNETAGVLMFPKSSHETNKEYEERLAVAESSRASVLPKGRRRTRRPSATGCARSPSAACRSCRARTTRRTTSSSCASTWRRCAPTSSTRTTRRARTTTSAPTASTHRRSRRASRSSPATRGSTSARGRWCTRRRRWSRR